jgi:hypothetical protein
MLAALLMASAAIAAAQNAAPIPYTLSFVQVTAPSLPPLQSYCLANVSATQWLILGGRTVGLHTFNPSGNFTAPNTMLWSINPTTGAALQVADLSQIDPTYGDPLTSTNQQCEDSPESGYWYIAGGYGFSHAANNFVTFPTILQIPVSQLVTIANSGQTPAQMQAAVATLLQNPANMITNPAMKITGGALSHTSAGLWLLSFGQIFDGQYNPFGGGFTQTYTQAVLPFTISENPFAIHPLQPIKSTASDAPFNRRDFDAGYDIDPATKQDRFAFFGGVFPPGAIAGYDYPVYLTSSGINISANPDHNVTQHFGFYEGPLIVAWDGSNVYHTFFGGIGHYFQTQSQSQSAVYQYVTQQGRNDGLPFIEDIDTLIENGSGQYQEYMSPNPVPGNLLHGASAEFVPNLAQSAKFQGIANSVVNLSTFTAGEKELIGYIYGGIEAANPLPCKPSTGTVATNALYQVYLSMTPWTGLAPASQATEAIGYYAHGDPAATAHSPQKQAKPAAALSVPAACSNVLTPANPPKGKNP